MLHWHINCYLLTCVDLVEGWWSGRGVAGSRRPQVGSSRRRLATAAFDQAVNVFLFIEHEHTNIVKPVGGGACCVADAGGISGSFHPTAPTPPYFGLSPTVECSNEGTWPSTAVNPTTSKFFQA